MVRFEELDERVPFAQQLGEDASPVVFMESWRVDGEYMQRQPGYLSTQLHRGIGGSTTFVNVAVWESVEDMRNAAMSLEFQASLQNYPSSAVASPHPFTKVAVPGICGD